LWIVANFVAYAIHEYVPAVDGCGTVAPWVDAERAVIAIEVAGIPIALLIAVMIAGFLVAAILDTFLAFAFQVEVVGICDLGYVDIGSAEHAATVSRVIDLAVLAGPLGRAIARVIADQVFANRIRLLARITRAFVPRVHFTMRTSSARWTITSVAVVSLGDAARAAVHARFGVAIGTGELAVDTVKVFRTVTRMPGLLGGAYATVLARRAVAKVHLTFAVPTYKTGFAIAVIVVDQLHAILGTGRRTRIRQALVDITFASRSDETGWTLTFESADLVGARAIVVASTDHAVVHVDLAYEAKSTGRAGTAEGIDQIVARAAVLAWIRLTIVDV